MFDISLRNIALPVIDAPPLSPSSPSSPSIDATLLIRRQLRLLTPRTPNQLHAYVKAVLGFDVPRVPMFPHHSAPFDYLQHAFFEHDSQQSRDCIVWANRGGGKTQIAAIATLLDLLFKPGIEIRILGGSFEQSSRMYRYLKRMLDTDLFRDLIADRFTGKYVQLTNDSRVEVISQSECAVRGMRVHKLRCDEVELFDADIWEAAQLVTRSGQCGDIYVRAAVETLSTMHRPYGLMQRVVSAALLNGSRLFRWNLLDTLQQCEPQRACNSCGLWDECRGRAKHNLHHGFFDINDAIIQKRRVDPLTWSAEMLCERPSTRDSVYAEFDRAVHIVHVDPPADSISQWIGGIDFGYREPTVLLWACIDHARVLWIVDELSLTNCITDSFIDRATQRTATAQRPVPVWIGADPAGHQRSEQTGRSTISLWQKRGWTMRTRASQIEPGIIAVRRRFKRADGSVWMRIHSRCAVLIESLTKYHYPADRPDATVPVKDGNDHACDALRYLVVNLDRVNSALGVRRYA